MSSAAHTPEFDALPLGARPRKTKGVFVSFATFVIVGFGLAGWYVSTRILAAEAQPTAAVAQSVQTVQPATVAVTVPQTASPVAQPDAEEVLPLSLEYYLQINTLGTSDDARYIKQLQGMGYHAELDPSAVGQDSRILIGPYSDQRSLSRARASLLASGVVAVDYIR